MTTQTRCQLALAFVLALAATSAAAASSALPTSHPLDLKVIAPVTDCADMTVADVSKAVGATTVVTGATVVDDGKDAAYCRLTVVADDYATFELHLPVATWRQRLLFGGGPGAQVTPAAIRLDQFVTASWQDLGHRDHEDDFATNAHFRVNGGYRGMHLQVLATKALIAKYYGKGPRFSYFNACSEPGREGMMEIQRYPEDFDGVGAGCPPINMTVNNGIFEGWNVLTNTGADGKPVITEDKLPLLHRVVLEQCDAADGAKDGIVSNPFLCHPDLSVAQCKAGQEAGECLTAGQIRVANELYKGAHDGQGGKLEPIGVLPGSELAWTATIVPGGRNPDEARAQTTTAIRSQFNYPALAGTWQLSELKFDRATFDATTRMRTLIDATNPDLRAFAKAGHKLILWQALGDTNVLPAHAVLYYTAVQKLMGAQAADEFVRFYVLPGVYHCGGGDGPVISDLLGPLMLWVERGVAPRALAGVHSPRPARAQMQGAGGPGGPPGAAGSPSAPAPLAAPDLTRPIYPYPYTAKYLGTGSVTDAANYVQGPAVLPPDELFNWFGSGFYKPGFQKWCTGNGAVLECKASR